MAGEIDLRKGTVSWFDVWRGFGLITPEDGGENVFFELSSYRSLAVGDAVEFVISVGDVFRRSTVAIIGPGGNRIMGKGCFGGACYRGGEVGHMAINRKRVGPCCNCRIMGGLATDFSDHKIEDDDDRGFSRGVEQRNWADLPRDVLWTIFKKIMAVDIIRSAQYVCRPWRELSLEPELWRQIVVRMPPDPMDMSALESLAMLAVKRSKGCVEDFYLKCFGSKKNRLIGYMSHRTTKLRRLCLISIYKMSKTALARAIRKLPLLEELEISFCFFSSNLVEVVGPACPQLKSFKLNFRPYKYIYEYDFDFDAEAFSIARHMQQLQHLQLIRNRLTKVGLLAILDSCLNLQCLDIRACFNVEFDENLRSKCVNIKEVRYPKDSTADLSSMRLSPMM